MTEEILTKSNELHCIISDLEETTTNAMLQKCEWIEFTFGNGSNRSTVCSDESIITKVRDLIVKENEIKLAKLKTEFENL